MFKNQKINGKIKYVTKTEMKKQQRRARKIVRQELVISREESRERAKKMLEFLKLVHPQNAKKGYVNAIEIKQLLRGDGATRSVDRYFNIYNLSSKETLERLTDRIEETFQFSHCMYYSLYTFDSKKEIQVPLIDENGRETYEYKRVFKITNENAVETSVLPIDFDNISEEEMREKLSFFHSLNIKPIVIFSGHGYQMLILLKKQRKAKNTFKEFTRKLLELNLQADASVDNVSQVFRMPFSRNCKSYSSEFRQYKPNDPEAIETEIVEMSYERYDYQEVMKKLDEEIRKRKEAEQVETTRRNEEDVEFIEEKVSDNIVYRSINEVDENSEHRELEEYYLLNFSLLPKVVQKILEGVEEGYRNSARLFLTIHLLKKYKIDQEKVREIILKLNERSKPSEDVSVVEEEFERFINNYSYYHQGYYDQNLIEKYGALHEIEIKKDFEEVKINNKVITSFHKIDHKSFPIYLALKMLEFETNRFEFSQREIAERLDVSLRTVSRNLQSLIRTSVVLKSKNWGGKGRLALYKLNPYFSKTKGYTALNVTLAEHMLEKLNAIEMILYTFLLYKVRSMKETSLYTTQDTIAEELELDRTTISKTTDQLALKRYIEKETIRREDSTLKSTYILKRN